MRLRPRSSQKPPAPGAAPVSAQPKSRALRTPPPPARCRFPPGKRGPRTGTGAIAARRRLPPAQGRKERRFATSLLLERVSGERASALASPIRADRRVFEGFRQSSPGPGGRLFRQCVARKEAAFGDLAGRLRRASPPPIEAIERDVIVR